MWTRTRPVARSTGALGEGPIPATLRALVDAVRTQVSSKLDRATYGSSRDAMYAVYECRALLDQLLKQAPAHWHLRAHDEAHGRMAAGGGGGVGGSQCSWCP